MKEAAPGLPFCASGFRVLLLMYGFSGRKVLTKDQAYVILILYDNYKEAGMNDLATMTETVMPLSIANARTIIEVKSTLL